MSTNGAGLHDFDWHWQQAFRGYGLVDNPLARTPMALALVNKRAHAMMGQEKELLALKVAAAKECEKTLEANQKAFAAQDAVSKPAMEKLRKLSEQMYADTARLHRQGIENLAAIERGEKVAMPRYGRLR